MNKLTLFALLILALNSCKTSQITNKKDQELEELFELMQGSYDSSMHAAADSTYYDISLEMHPVWKNSGEKWLYVEQSLSDQKDKPYRVRMYKLHRIDDQTIASEVYTIPNEQLYYGKYRNKRLFNELKPRDLELREGCAVFLKKQKDGTYSGSTGKNTCNSTLRGASYATSVVMIRDHQIISWDRGFDDQGNQVWGAEKGGYVFNKGPLKKMRPYAK